MQRPTGITILAILAAIIGVIALLAGLAAIGFGGVFAGAVGGTVGAAGGGLLVIAGLIALVAAFINLAFAYGAWNLRPWAWVLGVIGAGLSLLQSVLSVLGRGTLASEFVSIVIAAGILYYLNTPGVRSAFGRGPGQYLQ